MRLQVVRVTVSVTCGEEVYDYQQAQVVATGLLQKQATSELGGAYMLVGKITLTILSATIGGH